ALYRQAISDKLTANRFPENKAEELIQDWYAEVRPLYPEPVELLPLHEGDIIYFGDNTFEVLLVAGHTDGQSMFWSSQAKLLFTADILAAGAYLHFTDWPNTDLANPLENLFDSFDRIKALGVKRAFPGHGPVIEDLDSVIKGLMGKHRRNLDKVATAVTAPISAGELYPSLYQMYDYVHHHRVVMGEVLGYLNYLTSRGKLVCNQVDGRIVYMPPLNAP
ncbi:MAG TPA: MBL fold metallo-hydrolase, partial [Syntrophomonas sp.]|nr:MBL fold metallo-hydrolase [Syntrophomonas sp.]